MIKQGYKFYSASQNPFLEIQKQSGQPKKCVFNLSGENRRWVPLNGKIFQFCESSIILAVCVQSFVVRCYEGPVHTYYAKFCLFCKKSVNRLFLQFSANEFLTYTKIFSSVTNFKDAFEKILEAYNFLLSDENLSLLLDSYPLSGHLIAQT